MITARLRNALFGWTATLMLAASAAGCGGAGDEVETGDEQNVTETQTFAVDMAAYNGIFGTNYTDLADANTSKVTLGGQTLKSPVYVFDGKAPVVAPWDDHDGGESADGQRIENGRAALSKQLSAGGHRFYIGIKNHQNEKGFNEINFDAVGEASNSTLKEIFKIGATHIELVYPTNGDVVTVNSPQAYEEGLIGEPTYPLVFVSIDFDKYGLSAAKIAEYEENIRSWGVLFSALADFPGDYNGGDPLAVRDAARLKDHVTNLLKGLAGDAAAQAYFTKTENKIYCAELAFIAVTAGVRYPLNKKTMEPLVGAAAWKKIEKMIKDHNAGKASPLTQLNDNPRIGLIRDLKLAPAGMKDLQTIATGSNPNALALTPMTMSDIIEGFLKTYIQRKQLGEQVAPLQAGLLEKMRPGLLEQMGMDQLAPTDPKRVAVEDLYTQLVQATGKQYANYDEFRAAVKPLLDAARQVTGPRGDSGNGLFVPPAIWYHAAKGNGFSGLVTTKYFAHGVHWSAVNAAPTP